MLAGEKGTRTAESFNGEPKAAPLLHVEYEVPASYRLSQRLNTPDPVRVGEPVSFTVFITNTGQAWLDSVPLRYSYNNAFLTYGFGGEFSQPDSNDWQNDGVIDWTNALTSPLAPQASALVTVTFTAREDTSSLPDGRVTTQATAHDLHVDPDGPSGPLVAISALNDQTASASVSAYRPTAVELERASVRWRDGGIVLQWTTSSEVHISGFRWFRRTHSSSEFLPVHQSIIQAKHAGMPTGASYTWIDDEIDPDGDVSITYRLRIYHLDGSISKYDFPVPSGTDFQIYVPVIFHW